MTKLQKNPPLDRLIEVIETIRRERQAEVHKQSHPELKRFTQQELNDLACLTYKNLLRGSSRKLPTREDVLQIADYLECTLDQQNDLLIAAEYTPTPPLLHRFGLERAVEQGQAVIATLLFPALMVHSDWAVKGVNSLFGKLYGLDDPNMLVNTDYSMLGSHFDEEMPFKNRISVTPADWRENT